MGMYRSADHVQPSGSRPGKRHRKSQEQGQRPITPCFPPEVAETTHAQHRPIQDLLDTVRGAVDGPSISFGDILRAMDARSQPVLLLLPALILVSPLSGIPGLSSLGGLTIALVAGQILLGRPAIWLPGFLLRRQLPTARLIWALSKLERAASSHPTGQDHTTGGMVFRLRGVTCGAAYICTAAPLSSAFFRTRAFSATTLAQSLSYSGPGALASSRVLAAMG